MQSALDDRSRRARGMPGERRARLVPPLLIVGTLLAVLGSLCIGAYPMSFWRAADILLHLAWPTALPLHPAWTLKELAIVQGVRLPRVLVAVFAGMALGVSGGALQGMMRNPLVGPDLVGVSSGAACGGVLAMLLNWSPVGVVGLAFLGGLFAMACTFGLSRLAHADTDGVTVILAGIFVGAFCMACVGLALFLASDAQLPDMVFWMLGTFARADARQVWPVAIPTLGGGALLMLLRWRINLLSLGDLDAASLGVHVAGLRWALIVVVSFIVAAQVSVTGIIGWIGLVVPHCARMLTGPDHRRLLPAAALLGALFALGVDDFTRTVVQANVPAGVMTALLGTPVMCFVFWKSQQRGWSDD